MFQPKKTLVIGASENPQRYSFLAINLLRQYGHPVVAIGNRTGTVGDVPFSKERPAPAFVDTVTLYLNPSRQEEYYDYIFSLEPNRIIFNPGTENEAFERLAVSKNIEVLEACTLVLLKTGQY